jgi:hypothetical protein
MLKNKNRNRMLVLVAAVACFNLLVQSAAACDHSKLLTMMKGVREKSGAASGVARPMAPAKSVPAFGVLSQQGVAGIVGLWQVTDTYQGQVIDQYFDTWHADGNELFIDATNPIEDNVCQGIWTAASANTYKLKHMSWYFDDSGNLQGWAVFHDVIQLGADNNSFTGTEDVLVYDLNGNLIGEYDGDNLQATRVTVDF